MDASKEAMPNGAPPAPAEAPKEEKKLSGKELKALKAAEKQARRAKDKSDTPGPPQSKDGAPKQQKKDQKAGAGKGGPVKPALGATPSKQDGMSLRQRRQSGATQERPAVKATKKATKLQVPLFGHLATQRRYGIEGSSKDVHPAVLTLGLQMSRYEVCGSTARVLAMLLAFKSVIESYITPQGHHISRHFTPHELSHQIDYLKQCRPISISMGNAIRWLKDVIANIDPEMDEMEAKKELLYRIDNFMMTRIQAADQIIADAASEKIVDGDTIMVYGKSSVVLDTLRCAKKKGKQFKIIVVDSKPLFEGKNMAKDLAACGFEDIEYCMLAGVSHCKATRVILGAHAMMTNGRLFSRCGTALVAMTAHQQGITVMVLAESLKFADRAPLDSILFNETAQPLDLLPEGSDVKKWEENSNLQMLNLMYDVTPAEYITSIYSEFGVLPPSSIPAVIRVIEDTAQQGGM